MTSSQPIIRQIAWISLLPQMAIIALLCLAAYQISPDNFFISGALAYLLLALCLRNIIALHQRAGVRLFKKKQYKEAIPLFEKSYEFFSRHRWIDDWRFLTLLSSSGISYREMALLNMAFCSAQIGDGIKARKTYEKVLSEFPASGIAHAALRLMDAAKESFETNASSCDPDSRM
jgi:tetratricopeptide (TPR) repeat protein